MRRLIVLTAVLACAGGAFAPVFAQKTAPAVTRDSDHDGVPDTRDRCRGTPPNTRVDERGCPVAAAEAPAPTAPTQAAAAPAGAPAQGAVIVPAGAAPAQGAVIAPTGAARPPTGPPAGQAQHPAVDSARVAAAPKPARQAPSGLPTPAGAVTAAPGAGGQAHAQPPSGQAPSGQAPSGQAPSGQVAAPAAGAPTVPAAQQAQQQAAAHPPAAAQGQAAAQGAAPSGAAPSGAAPSGAAPAPAAPAAPAPTVPAAGAPAGAAVSAPSGNRPAGQAEPQPQAQPAAPPPAAPVAAGFSVESYSGTSQAELAGYARHVAQRLDSAIVALVSIFRNTSGAPLAGASSPSVLSSRERGRWSRCRVLYFDLASYTDAVALLRDSLTSNAEAQHAATDLAEALEAAQSLAECDNIGSMIEAPDRWSPWQRNYETSAGNFYRSWYTQVRAVHEADRALARALNAGLPAARRIPDIPGLPPNPPYFTGSDR